jgi:hypothetical protein
VTRAAARFNHQTVNIHNFNFRHDLFEDRLRQIEENFAEKFKDVLDLVSEIETGIKNAIEELRPEDVAHRIELFEEYDLVQKYKNELNSIDEDSQACDEGSSWLEKQRGHLIEYAANTICKGDLHMEIPDRDRSNPHSIQLFCQDLDSYFRWLEHYIRLSAPPKKIPDGVISFIFPRSIYIKAFILIRDNIISQKSDISETGTTMLAMYIDRFLIEETHHSLEY